MIGPALVSNTTDSVRTSTWRCVLPEADHGNPLSVGRMTMSSLSGKFQGQRAVYVVQSGVVAWEDPEPIADWTSKTVTVCAVDVALLTAMLKEVLGAEFIRRRSIFRCHLSALPSSQTAVQRRRLANALQADVPGFSGTVVRFHDAVALSVSGVKSVPEIELAYLSSYRQTFLVAMQEGGVTPVAISESLSDLSLPLDGKAIANVRSRHSTIVVIRALEEENQCVFQIVCDPVTSESVAKLMNKMAVRRAADRVAASQALGVIPKEHL